MALAISRYEHPLWVILVPPNKTLFSVVPHDSSLSWFKIGCGKFWTSTALYKVFFTSKISVMFGLSCQLIEIQKHLWGDRPLGLLLRNLYDYVE